MAVLFNSVVPRRGCAGLFFSCKGRPGGVGRRHRVTAATAAPLGHAVEGAAAPVTRAPQRARAKPQKRPGAERHTGRGDSRAPAPGREERRQGRRSAPPAGARHSAPPSDDRNPTRAPAAEERPATTRREGERSDPTHGDGAAQRRRGTQPERSTAGAARRGAGGGTGGARPPQRAAPPAGRGRGSRRSDGRRRAPTGRSGSAPSEAKAARQRSRAATPGAERRPEGARATRRKAARRRARMCAAHRLSPAAQPDRARTGHGGSERPPRRCAAAGSRAAPQDTGAVAFPKLAISIAKGMKKRQSVQEPACKGAPPPILDIGTELRQRPRR